MKFSSLFGLLRSGKSVVCDGGNANSVTDYVFSPEDYSDIFGNMPMSWCVHNGKIGVGKAEVGFWLPELGGCAVTVVFDGVLPSLGDLSKWVICIICEDNDAVWKYVNLNTVEPMSSGIRHLGNVMVKNNYSAAVYKISPEYVKKDVMVQSDPFVGYDWYVTENSADVVSLAVPVQETFGGCFCLNFTVCGEFNAGVFMYNKETKENKMLMYHMFCCK